MAECSEHRYDPRRTVVVSNYPPSVGEEELTIYFQKEKNGGGDVDGVVVDGNIAFVIFDHPEGLERVRGSLHESGLSYNPDRSHSVSVVIIGD